ncbi:hypothetical protein M9H77_12539 [Catharanthus roseus]|uniref:Uncharacterized protein n=1 Tax=Catharanthus roseus TaxID=4058 RepID=A0ACC0BHP6_CATRO|nr:hypothetical protein M9H77_12539 [Catharanthus roseus]
MCIYCYVDQATEPIYYYQPFNNEKEEENRKEPIYYNKVVSVLFFTFREVVGRTTRKTVTERPSKGKRRRIPQVKPVSLKLSHTYGVKNDSRHRFSAVESRRAARKTNRELVRGREREDRRSERECRRQRWHQQRKRRLGQAVEKRTLYSQVAWVGRVEPGPPGIKVQPVHSTPMRPSPVIHHRD